MGFRQSLGSIQRRNSNAVTIPMKHSHRFAHPLHSCFRDICSFGALALVAVTPLTAQNQKVISGKPQALSRMPITTGGQLSAATNDKVPVMVELRDAPAANLYAQELKLAQAQANARIAKAVAAAKTPAAASMALQQQSTKVEISSAAVQQLKATVQRLNQVQQEILPALTGGNIGGQVIYRVQKAYNGIAMMVTRDKIAAIAALPGVKAVHNMVPKYPEAFSDIDFLGARSFWNPPPPAAAPNGLGIHGENIKVADIDTGLDYIHVNFGGPGSSGYSVVPNHTTAPNAYFPTPKVPGGFDFAGDAYDGTNTPVPDPDPFDGNGHGTGTASLIAGYGVTSSGFVYSGSYDSSTPIGALAISPGFAPEAKIYPLRVFGNTGSTNLVTEAIDYAMDPNGDGSFADHMDVINMSLGAPDGFADDPDQVSASNAAAIGIIVCSAAGNDGDSYYIVSGPSVATGTLSVAATFNDQAGFIFDSNVTSNTAGGGGVGVKYFSIKGSASSPIPAGGITGNVVYAVPHDGNASALTNAANINGNICLIDRGATTFTDKVTKAFNAGATAVIVDNFNNPGADPILMSTAGQPAIVDVMISRTDRDTINTAAGGFDATTGVPTNPVNVTINNDSGVVSHGGAAPDTIPTYSSRGPRSGDNALKPDVSAPAEVVGVAAPFTGNKVENFNGTSSATPHVAGTMALFRQFHPSWTVHELNALVCNTATHDLFTTTPGPSPSPTPSVEYGIGRIGAGRIDLAKASTATVVAFDQIDNSPGVSFGAVEVPVDGSASLVKNVLVENKGVNNVTYNLSYQDVTPVAGANFTVPANITVNAGASGTIPVTFSATGSSLKHARETSVSPIRIYASFGFALDRQWLTEKTGYLVLKPTGGKTPTIRVALYAAPKPVSSMHASSPGVVPTASTGSFNVNLTGSGVNSGPNLGGGFDILSLVKSLELQYASASVGSPSAPTDPNVIKYVGVTSDYASYANTGGDTSLTTISFAIDGFGDFTVPAIYDVADRRLFIDVNQDGTDDFEIILDSFGDATLAPAQGDIDNVYIPVVFDLNNPANSATSNYFTNGFDPQTADSNIFNNSAVVVSVDASQLGLLGSGQSAFNYRVETHDRNGNVVDSTPELTYDLANPGLESDGGNFEPFFYVDLAGNSIPVNYNGTNFRNNASIGVLLVHMHNGDGNRSDAIVFRKPTISGFSPSHGPARTLVTITGSNFNSGTSVTFNNKPAAAVNVLSSTTLVATVPSGAKTGRIRVSNAAGTATSVTNFSVP